ncbi:MAG: hypothetical protein DMG45_01685 [Acidobacteria bacterium]|nr:MAG: hypothetical protein DMG45_01685 [Acidobacteriota bacterium]
MTAAIQTHDLTKRYRSVRALDHVNLEVQEGAVYALVGPNGAGKTTGIKILMNLMQTDSPIVLQADRLRFRKPGHPRMDEGRCASQVSQRVLSHLGSSTGEGPGQTV